MMTQTITNNAVDAYIKEDTVHNKWIVSGPSIGKIELSSITAARALVDVYQRAGAVVTQQRNVTPVAVRPTIANFKTFNIAPTLATTLDKMAIPATKFGSQTFDHWIEKTPAPLAKRNTQYRIRYVNGNTKYFATLTSARESVRDIWNRDILYQFTKPVTKPVLPPVPKPELRSSRLAGGAQVFVRFGDKTQRVAVGEQFELDGIRLVLVKVPNGI